MGQDIATVIGKGTFNSPFEVGVRALFILAESFPRELELQRLIYLDYALVHSEDFEDGPQSLHPATPSRSAEYLSRREVLEEGLLLMCSKGLVTVVPTSAGLRYKGSEQARPFVDSLTSSYFDAMRHRARWAATTFGKLPLGELSAYFSERAGKWGSEFVFMRDLSRELDDIWGSEGQ